MTEKKQQIHAYIKLLIICICAGLYAWGGMEMKWLRRVLAPSICAVTMLCYSRDWKTLLTMPLMFGGLSMGYGGTALWYKIVRRGLFGLINGIASSGYNVYTWIASADRATTRKYVTLTIWQVAFLVCAYVLFGVWNPLPNARIEELFLGMCYFTIPILSIKER